MLTGMSLPCTLGPGRLFWSGHSTCVSPFLVTTHCHEKATLIMMGMDSKPGPPQHRRMALLRGWGWGFAGMLSLWPWLPGSLCTLRLGLLICTWRQQKAHRRS